MKINIKTSESGKREFGIEEASITIGVGEILSLYKIIDKIEKEENRKAIEKSAILKEASRIAFDKIDKTKNNIL